jgi:hypothetical protein
MATSDIYLRENRVNVVGSGTEVEGEIERGALEVSVPGDDRTPSIRMSAEQANLNVGGGDGTSTEGDVRVNDGSGKTRVQVTGADDGNRPGSERVWINGGDGSITLGEDLGQVGDGSGIQLRGTTDGDYTGAYLSVGEPSSDDELVESGNGRVELQALTDPQKSGAAGMARFRPHGRSEESVSIRGDQAQISLGYSVTRRQFSGGNDIDELDEQSPYGVGPGFDTDTGTGTIDYEVVAGENGVVRFDDGTGTNFRVVAEDGKLKIRGPAALDTEYLVIDPQNEEIRTPWSFVEE